MSDVSCPLFPGCVVSKERMSNRKSLKDQLKGIAERNKALGGYTHNQTTTRKPSLLFSEKEAADIDYDTVYEIGLKGITGLCELEPIFLKFHPSLFDRLPPESSDRSLKTADENKQLDQIIKSFLRLCQPFYLERCCQQALEWLIRAFRINELNVNECLDCILPYHDTVEFVRFVQILYFKEDDAYGFLFTPVKQGGQLITREFIAKRCLVDRRILEWSLDAFLFLLASQSSLTRPLCPKFVAVLCAEYLDRIKQIDAIILSLILPFAQSLLKAASEEVKLAGLFVAGCLFERCTELSADVVNQFINDALNNTNESLNEEMVMMITRMALLFPNSVVVEGGHGQRLLEYLENRKDDHHQLIKPNSLMELINH